MADEDTLEAALAALLGPLVAGRIYPDTAPDDPEFPLIIYQQVGGKAYQYLEKKLPDYRHARMQIMVWSKRRLEASRISLEVGRLIIESPLIAESYGEPAWMPNDVLHIRGTRQDFGIWFPR
ncbi:DUF3168 domain-containing protein [Dyella marensis]|uniref:DUF3168 domain-containing protein n=1 Tax=Dyella marensis TaxID=500610 RepID=A0A1I1ZYC1_9GAMM|nr:MULTISPECIES: DUF3168 domain-containing protein [Dyella]SFE36497.1 Protein of unknown function [Dyella marensis]